MTRQMADASFREEQVAGIKAPQVAVVNRLCDQLMLEKPGYRVPYVAPHYSASTARILSLSSNPGPRASGEKGSGFLSIENDDPSAARMGLIFETVGLSGSDVVPWNAYPWHVHEAHPNGLTLELIDEGLDPLQRLLNLHPNIRAIVAHGGDAHRSMKRFRKGNYTNYAEDRGLKIWETRHTSNRAFILPKVEQKLVLEGVCATYREAMEYVGLAPIPTADDALATSTGAQLRQAALEAIADVADSTREDRAHLFIGALSRKERESLLVELLTSDLRE